MGILDVGREKRPALNCVYVQSVRTCLDTLLMEPALRLSSVQ